MRAKRPRPKFRGTVELLVRRALNHELPVEQRDAAIAAWAIENILDKTHDRRHLTRILRRAARDAQKT